MRWAHKDSEGTITEYNGLPPTWQNISNFFALENDIEYLRTLGWYPLVDDTSPVADGSLYYYCPPTYTIDDNFVIRRNCEILPYPNPPSAEYLEQERQNEFFKRLREVRDNLLKGSDWTQLSDVQLMKSEEWKTAWATYRQQLRDLPDQYANDTTMDIDQVVWPVFSGA